MNSLSVPNTVTNFPKQFIQQWYRRHIKGCHKHTDKQREHKELPGYSRLDSHGYATAHWAILWVERKNMFSGLLLDFMPASWPTLSRATVGFLSIKGLPDFVEKPSGMSNSMRELTKTLGTYVY